MLPPFWYSASQIFAVSVPPNSDLYLLNSAIPTVIYSCSPSMYHNPTIDSGQKAGGNHEIHFAYFHSVRNHNLLLSDIQYLKIYSVHFSSLWWNGKSRHCYSLMAEVEKRLVLLTLPFFCCIPLSLRLSPSPLPSLF